MWNNIVSQKDDFLKTCLLWNVSNHVFYRIFSLFSKLQHSFTSKDRSILKIIFNRKYFNRCILKRFWEIWFVFFREKHKLHHFFTTVTRCDLGKNMVFPFWKCEFSVSEALLNWKIFFENEDTKGIWGEIIVDFHF